MSWVVFCCVPVINGNKHFIGIDQTRLSGYKKESKERLRNVVPNSSLKISFGRRPADLHRSTSRSLLETSPKLIHNQAPQGPSTTCQRAHPISAAARSQNGKRWMKCCGAHTRNGCRVPGLHFLENVSAAEPMQENDAPWWGEIYFCGTYPISPSTPLAA